MVELWSFFLTDDSLLSCFLQCNVNSCVFSLKVDSLKDTARKGRSKPKGWGRGEKLPTKDNKDAKGTCNLLIPVKIIQKMKTDPETNMKD